tara:strand:- start:84 stop:482 length:399 start_codon:yes stop_codon:yes gene_type:complete
MRSLLIILIGFTLILSGCTGAGNESIKNATESQVKKQIIEGVTTKDQIQAMFGSPIKTSYTGNGSLIWTYQFDDTTALTPETIGSVLFTWGLAGTKTKGTRNELVVLFDENNLVKKFNMSNSKINSGTNLFK